MTEANCTRCGATATGDSFEDARIKIDHAIGQSRGIPCGDNYNCVVEVKETKSPKTDEGSYKKVEGMSAEKIVLDESKYNEPKPASTKKSKSTK